MDHEKFDPQQGDQNAFQQFEPEGFMDRPELTPEEIWNLPMSSFVRWRKRHDYPRILAHFSKKLNGFEDWKAAFSLDDDFLMNYGISNCINANPAKDKTKFLVERDWKGERMRFISYKNIDGRFYNLGAAPVNHTSIKNFVGYIDWCIQRKIRIHPDYKEYDLLSLWSKSSPPGGVHLGQVSILHGLRLLKIGGIQVVPNGIGLIQGKHFEFVNAEYLSFSGKINTQNQPLFFQNSFLDHLTCENLELSLVQFDHCKLGGLHISDSTIQQWSFAMSAVNGKISGTDLRWSNVFGGGFRVDISNCTLLDVDARWSSTREIGFENTFRELKRAYAGQAEDKKAIQYFLLEKNAERHRIRNELYDFSHSSIFKMTKLERLRFNSLHIMHHVWLLTALSINSFYWGYGRKPYRVLRNSAFIILLFALIYYVRQVQIHMPVGSSHMTLWDSLYYSTVTFTTLGYGDIYPLGSLRFFAAMEACMGGLSFGFLAAAFANFKY
jgi:hypothetical protein